MVIDSLFFKNNSYKARGVSTYSTSEPQLISPKVIGIPKTNITEVSITLQRIEEICFVKNTTQNRFTNTIFSKSLRIEMNKTEFWSVSGE